MRKILLFFTPFLLLIGGHGVSAQEVFINEIHYDNTGADTGEAIEIAGPAGTDMTGWSLVLYNGSTGFVYNNLTLSGNIPDSGNGFGFVNEAYPSNGIQNGSPDGIALIDNNGLVIQFLTYEGSFTAVGGPADGLSGTDIGVSEAGGDPIGFSLQLGGTGTSYTDFTWQVPNENTFGALNSGQSFGSAPIDPEEPGDPEEPTDPETPIDPENVVVFINEFHYDNEGADVGEGIEVAGTAGANLSGWNLVLYNGSNGSTYGTTILSGVIPDQDNGFGTLFFPISGLQNGSPDGFALVDPANSVVQYLTYEGSFVASNGPASGLTSIDVGVAEDGNTPVGFSLQLQGKGNKYSDFTWTPLAIANTEGRINTGQSFGGVIVEEPEPELVLISIAEARQRPQGSTVIVKGILTASDQLGGPAYLQDETGGIPVFDPVIHGAGNFQIGDEIQFTANLGAFQQQIQLGNVSDIQLISSGNVVLPQVVSISEISSALEGQLIQVLGASFNTPKGLLFPESNYTITDGTGNLQLRIDGDVRSLIGREVPSDAQTITGVLGSFRGSLQVFPRFLEDLPGTTPFEAEGSTIPANETLDVMTWNMEFFGSTITNFGPTDVTLQAANALKVFQATLPDVIAVQEISDEALLADIVAQLPGYAVICSDRFSRSFDAPDPNFPPQKLCLIYNTAVVEILDTKVLFEQLYDEARTGMNDALEGYPTGSPSSFWSSGRLPWLVTAIADINGVKEKINFINVHAKSGAGNEDLARKRFDNQVLKDTLDAFYSDANIVLLGDYNDDLDESIGGGVTTYEVVISDPDFDGVTISLSEAGLRSFIFNDNMIDHITLSNELFDNYLEGSETLYIPFNEIDNYANTTSDHLPVSVRLIAGDPIVSDAGDGAVVYFGYKPLASTTLRAADATGGTGIYTYSWSDGQVGQEITVSPTETTTYTLTVTDEAGNIFTDEVTVCVVDVRSGKKGNKVIVCLPAGKSGKKVTLSVATQAVPAMLRNGATLGACGIVPCGIVEEDILEEEGFEFAKIVRIFPNPMDDFITVELNRGLTLEVSYILFNHRGETISSGLSGFENGKLRLQFPVNNLRKGIYYLHLNQGRETKIVRLWKR